MVFADDEENGSGKLSFSEVDSFLTPYVTAEEYEAELKTGGGKRRVSLYGRSLQDEVYRYGLLAKDIARREEHDVIHAHDWLAFPAGMAAKVISGKPLFVHVHATEFDRTGGQGVNQIVYGIERAGLHAADRVITVSSYTKKMVVNHYGVPAEKVSIVHNGIDASDYTEGRAVDETFKELKKDGSKIVLFVGRITIQKGPDYFVRLAERVLALRPKTYFVVSGSGDMERQMIQDAAYRKLSDRFIFAGFLRGEALNATYRAADLYVLPSVSEPFGITPLESLIQKTPVLISKQSGVAEILHHALKADFWDIDEMANKVIAVIDHPVLHETLIENGHKEARHATWQKAAEKVATLYEAFTRKPALVPVRI
jgi:glycosyltransferase involved in cell wall biosynthesis